MPEHQADFCLTARHEECPVLALDGAGGLPARIRAVEEPGRRVRWALVLPGVLGLIALVVLMILWLGGGLASGAAAEPTQGASMFLMQPSSTPTRPPTSTPLPSATSLPPTPTPSPPALTTATAGPGFGTPLAPGQPYLVHRVGQGETLFFIAATYATSVEAIRAVNGLAEVPLWIDQMLVVPQGVADPTGLPRLVAYVVDEGGEDLEAVAFAHGTSVQALSQYNDLGPSPAMPGGRLLIIPLP